MKKLIITARMLLSLVFFSIVIVIYTPIGENEKVKSFILSQEAILGFIYEDETVYSSGYSEENWVKYMLAILRMKLFSYLATLLKKTLKILSSNIGIIHNKEQKIPIIVLELLSLTRMKKLRK